MAHREELVRAGDAKAHLGPAASVARSRIDGESGSGTSTATPSRSPLLVQGRSRAGEPATSTTPARSTPGTSGRKVDAQRWLDERRAARPRQTTSRPGWRGRPWGSGATPGSRATAAARVDGPAGRGAHQARSRPHFGPMRLGVGPALARSRLDRPAHGRGAAPTPTSTRCTPGSSQLFTDAVHDGLVAETRARGARLPGTGQATALRRHHRAGVGAARRDARAPRARRSCSARFAGLRLAEACGSAGRGRRLHARRDLAGGPVPGRAAQDRDISRTPIPIPQSSPSCSPRRVAVGRAKRSSRTRRGRPSRALDARARHPRGPEQGPGPARRLPVPRPAALLRLAAHRQGST